MSALITPLIVCGGSGMRLLPVSRDARPKQFLRLIGRYTTFQETVLRVSDPSLFGRMVVIANGDHHHLVDAQLKELGVETDVLFEPERRGSGPAILAATLWAAAIHDPDMEILALAADHAVKDVDGFRLACRKGRALAQRGSIVVFGIEPDHPVTDYGYIQRGEKLHPSAYAVRRFVEKPDAESAKRYVNEGYLWHAGNFLFQARSLIDEYRRCDSATADAVAKAVEKADNDANFISLDAAAFTRAANQSIDHAIMEKTSRAAVVPVTHDWLDIGSWQAIHRLLSRSTADDAPSAVRCLTIKPGEILLVTEHLSPSEYWIVAGGICVATVAGETQRLKANEFAHVAAGTEHRIENHGASDLHIVVVPDTILQP